jgi:hypothetical protein
MKARSVAVNVLALLGLLLAGCDLALPTLAERVARSGSGYVFQRVDETARPADALSPADVTVVIEEYSDGRFAVQRIEFGQLRPNVSGPSRLAYVADIVDALHPERGRQLMFMDATTGEILGAPAL